MEEAMTSAETSPLAQRIGRTGVWLGAIGQSSAARAREAAAEIERLGYGALWLGEGPATKEAFTHAALLLAATERITVGTGIANIWVRDATAANAAANTLAEAYPDRFLLGLGASHAPLVDDRGHQYRKPLAAMRDYLDGIDAARYDAPRPSHPTPRVLAALRPRMLELARDRAAGAHPYFVPPEHTAQAREILGDGPLLAPEQAVVLETDPAAARALARGHTRFYLSLPNYANNLRALGFGDEDFADGGSDRLVDAIVAWGDIDAVKARVDRHLDAGADHVAIQPIAAGGAIGLDQLRALAPALL
jgi:probable F420-dependent oxidoreductase